MEDDGSLTNDLVEFDVPAAWVVGFPSVGTVTVMLPRDLVVIEAADLLP